MSRIINARSPHYITMTQSGGVVTRGVMELFIYPGNINSDLPLTPQYTIDKTPLTSDTDNFCVWEVSELIRDYLYTNYYTEAVDAVWVRFQMTKYASGQVYNYYFTRLAFDGFGYFEEGTNPRFTAIPTEAHFTPMVLQSNLCVPFVRGRDLKIPIFSETEPTIETDIPLGVWNHVDDFWINSDVNWNETSTDIIVPNSSDTEVKINYVIISTDNAVTGDTITVTSAGTEPTGGEAQTVTLTINEICEPRYEPIRIIFYNKFGALQSMWFTKKNVVKTNIKSETYNNNILDYAADAAAGGVTYSTTKHKVKRFNVTPRQSITLNTPLMNECLQDAFEQMLMSEQIWLEDTTDTLPVVIKTSNVVRKTGVNDKAMIQYTVDFDYAFNTINDIR